MAKTRSIAPIGGSPPLKLDDARHIEADAMHGALLCPRRKMLCGA
jgi:hypothetical protein